MASWRKILTETHTDSHPAPTNRDTRNQVAGTYNTVIGIDTDFDLAANEHIDTITLTDGVIQGLTKQTMSAQDLNAWTSTGTVDDSEFLRVNDHNAKEFETLTAAEVRTALNVANGATANVGDITSVVAGTGMSGGGTSGDVTLNCTITNNNQLTNGAGYTTNTGDITGVTAGTGLTGGGTSGGVTLNVNTGAVANGAATIPTGDHVYDWVTAQNYGSGSGDITAVVAGTGLSGGATSGSATINVEATQAITNISGNLTIAGDLTVSGSTTTVNTEEINLADNNIVLNSNYTSSSPSEDCGITVERGTQTNVMMFWDESEDAWYVKDLLANGRVMVQGRDSSNPGSSDNGNGTGQMWFNTSSGDLYLRVS